MNKDQIKPIFPESPEAATFKTGLSGWVDRHGRFWGDDEKSVGRRFDSSQQHHKINRLQEFI